MSDPVLTVNGLDLLAASEDGTYELAACGASSGMNFGQPQTITTTMQSFLQDGSIVATTRHDNRTVTLYVKVMGADQEGIVLGEAALTAACISTWGSDGQIIPVVWTPPDGVPSIFDCTAAALAQSDWDDFDELFPDRNGMIYQLTLTCLPFAEADTDVTLTIDAPTDTSPVSPTVTEVDDCSTLTGWTFDGGTGSPTTYLWQATDTGRGTYVAGRKWPNQAVNGRITVSSALKRTFGTAINMGATPYLSITCGCFWMSGSSNAGSSGLNLTFQINGSSATPIASSANTYYFKFSGTLNSLTISMSGSTSVSSADSAQVYASDISRQDMLTAGSTTQKQISNQFPIQGSVRTPANIGLQAVDPSTGDAAALGQVLVHTSRVGAGPFSLMRYCGGSPSNDTTAYSNEAITLAGGVNFDAPYNAFRAAGYLVLARVKASVSGTYTGTFAVSTRFGGNTLGQVITYSFSVTITAANTWQVVTLGMCPLPVTQTDANAGAVIRVTLTSASLTLDDCWFCDQDNGQTTLVDCTTHSSLWIDSPDGYSQPHLWIGDDPDRGNGAWQPSTEIMAWGAHEFWPDGCNIFVASLNPVAVSLTYTPRGHTRAPKVAA